MVRRYLSWLLLCTSLEVSGQIFEFTDLEKLPAAVNSNGEESVPLLAPDQSKLFFVRSLYDGNRGGKYGGQDIWVSERVAGTWKPATNEFRYVNNRDNNVLAGLSADGNVAYILNSSPSSRLAGIHISKIRGKEWSRAEFIPIPGIENEDFVGMFVAPEFDIVLLSMRGGDSLGEEDLYICVKDKSGNWSKPRNLGPTINTKGFEISPFLSADKKKLYFSSNGPKGFGDADIYCSERLYNSWETWSAPVNLGPTVNSKKFDAYFSIYGDTIAYFTSNRDKALADIYTVKVSEKPGLLAAGQSYLHKDEWDRLIGKNVQAKLLFEQKNPTLTVAHRELIYYIARKVSLMEDIGFHVIVREEDDPALTADRLKQIYGELRQSGIELKRIREEQTPSAIKTSNVAVIELLLYREEPH
ncbi:MAG TPA: hypothetical protein VEB86_16760 [Chryseosolibacter sp.]|nr:hypothetical protein [Chryseosolibacter sp.]